MQNEVSEKNDVLKKIYKETKEINERQKHIIEQLHNTNQQLQNTNQRQQNTIHNQHVSLLNQTKRIQYLENFITQITCNRNNNMTNDGNVYDNPFSAVAPLSYNNLNDGGVENLLSNMT
eukprot:Awhi_evm1s4134